KALEYGIELAAAVSVRANHDQPTEQVLLHIAYSLATPFGEAPPDPECCDLAIALVKLAEDLARQEKVSAARSQVDQQIRSESTLAEAYAGKGQLDKAVTHGERALRLCRKAIPPPGVDEKQFRQDMKNLARQLEADLARFKKGGATPRK